MTLTKDSSAVHDWHEIEVPWPNKLVSAIVTPPLRY